MRSNFSKLVSGVYPSLFGILLCCQYGCGENKLATVSDDPPCPVKILTVNLQAQELCREYPGKVRAGRRVKLAFEVGGRIISFPIKCGDRVRQGQVLGKLDARDFENTLKSTTATYEESKSEFNRYSKLIDKAVVSTAAYEGKKKAYEVAEAAMKTAQKALEDTVLPAPFNGVVAGTYVDNYQNIPAHEPVLSLQDISRIEIVCNIPEKDIIRSDVGASGEQINRSFILTVYFPALGTRDFPVEVKEFETEADPALQTFKAVLSMNVPLGINIMPGMTAMFRAVRKNAVAPVNGAWVPASAVMEDNSGRKFVWLIGQDMRVRSRKVEIGELKGENIFISNGLVTGDRIAITGAALLTDGAKVTELTAIDGHKLASAQVIIP